MVLVEAEANYFLNDETAARAALVELNATSGRNPEYTCDKSGEALWNEIMDYRELELWVKVCMERLQEMEPRHSPSQFCRRW